MNGRKTSVRNALPYEVSVRAKVGGKWLAADIGTTAVSMVVPLSELHAVGGLKAAYHVASKGVTIASGLGAAMSRSSKLIEPGQTLPIHTVGAVKRWTSVSGLVGCLGGKATLRISIFDEHEQRLAVVNAAPGSVLTVDADGITDQAGRTEKWTHDEAERQPS